MSGSSPTPKPAAGGDPAMDDILASIRRILNEDEQMPAAAPADVAVAPAVADAEPLDLTEAMMVQPVTPAEPAPPAPPPAPVVAVAAPVAPLPAPEADALVAPAVAAATSAAMSQLMRAVAQERTATVSRGGTTIEDVVRETVRPLLKEWLDHHLPPLVERLVRAEIERVVGRSLT